MSAVVSQHPGSKKLPFGTLLVSGVIIAVVLWLILDPSLGQVLLQWLPYLATGFMMNVLISVLAIAIGTFIGVMLGIMELAPYKIVRAPALTYVQIFRNAPHLVLIFAATYIFPFELVIFGDYIPFPDWIKAVVGLAIPASAHIAEITRGAIQSIPTAQWEAAQGLGFSRNQTLRWIILPQCVKRSLPPWMNLYASITMGTALASLVGVHELLHAATDASTAVQRNDFTVVVYLTVLMAFFLFCYPVSRFTQRLERRFASR
ncbi:amino acid ABC transporter permease [Rhizobium sp. RM]|uniref:amino acid ABC transporter permease n=1 Tax=Rhizobium sp. RM TaxID=2748079 RepID=UPI00110EB37C|nr:amino acid ABC transporter permease [Rhizobium sp. RM]NWJ23710.1 amino acid ABC transporter permease [Rhizobium sp. RM]TMV19536.1 amino acid ABC transporter permease [Rhizobium sp. Td3]